MQPYPFTPYLQASVAVAALLIGTSALFASFTVWRGERNARMVEIGVGVLRADPAKEPSTAAARTWALDLIDANAGGIKFSAEARQELLGQALTWVDVGGYDPGYTGGGYHPTPKSDRKKNSN